MEVRLRMLTPDDADWLVALDREAAPLAAPKGWDHQDLARSLAEGEWAGPRAWGWAVLLDGQPVGVALVEGLDGPDATIDLRIASVARGRGIGREVLRQLADHHFSDCPGLQRLSGRTHEHNVPMQRAFNAAGFRMEARYRHSLPTPDGGFANEWGYALTREDWAAGRHRADETGYDLHGLQFVVEDVSGQAPQVVRGTVYKFLQEGRRVLARYAGGPIVEGELAGVIVDDVLRYHFVHLLEGPTPSPVTGAGRSRLQRRGDGRLELISDWSADDGRTGTQVLVERLEP